MAAQPAIIYDEAVLPLLSVTERYSDDMSIIYVFEELNLDDAQRNRLINDGLSSVEALVDQYGYDTKSLERYLQNLNKTFATSNDANLRVYFSPSVIMQFCGLLFYFNHCINSFHICPDILLVDGTFMLENYEQLKEMDKIHKDDDDDNNEVDLPKLKGHENWVKWRDAFLAILSSTIGTRNIPIDYLTDQSERETLRGNAAYIEYDTVNLEDDGIFITKTVHFGPAFRSDSARLWKKLKAALINTPPYNHISTYNNTKNGYAAWKALLTTYQGSDYVERLRDGAFAALAKAHYRGETKNFGWEKYVEIHVAAHKQLIDAGYNNGLGMDEETKIQYLKQNIRAEAGIEHALTIARSNNTYRYDFDLFVSFISGEVNARSDRQKQLKEATMRVSKVSGRGGTKNHNNSGRGNVSNNQPDSVRWKDRPSRMVDGKLVYGAQYPKHRFSALTPAQRRAIIQLKSQYYNSKKEGSNNMVAALQAVQDDMTTLETRIVSAVQRASGEQNDNNNDDISQVTNETGNNTKRSLAQSGSIGSFLASQKKRKEGNN